MLEQNDPYLYPGTNILINKFDIRDLVKLQELEGVIFALKSIEPLPKGNLDYEHLKAIHKHFFDDLYSWAGDERTVDMSKGNSFFARTPYIKSTLDKLFNQLNSDNYRKRTAKRILVNRYEF